MGDKKDEAEDESTTPNNSEVEALSTISRSTLQSFFDNLPQSMNTRRRFSAFRPVPPPPPEAFMLRPTEQSESCSTILRSEEIAEGANIPVVEDSREGASDLERFLKNQFNKVKSDGNVEDEDLVDHK